MKENLRVVIAGHIDHGKSTLIGRLLFDTQQIPLNMEAHLNDHGQHAGKFAFVTDQLAEEQHNNITIDTSQVQFKGTVRDYTLIDTPGHREFLKNMITGTTQADAAVLVVDAVEGLRQQTYYHAYLISMLGIHSVILVINKMDLVNYSQSRFRELSHEMTSYVRRLGLEVSSAIALSSQNGDNVARSSRKMPEQISFFNALEALPTKKSLSSHSLRFLVQTPFIRNGNQYTLGYVASGTLKTGNEVLWEPTGYTTKVISIIVSDQETDCAESGHSAALLLDKPATIQRGQVGYHAGKPTWTADQVNLRIFWINNEPLRDNSSVEVLCGTQRCLASLKINAIIDLRHLELTKAESCQLKDSQIADITLKLHDRICIDPFGAGQPLGKMAIVYNGRIAGGGVVRDRNTNRVELINSHPIGIKK